MLKYSFADKKNIKNISFNLNGDFDFLPSEDFISEENLANDDFIDLDITKYRLSSNVNFIFNFYNNTYNNDFISAGFTEEEINISNKSYRYSYILIQLYDNFNSKNQRLIHTGYIPIYLFPDKFNAIFNINIFTKYFEFNNIYIPNIYNFINNQNIYFKFSFFNAKTGKLNLFFNQDITNNTEEKMYFKSFLNTVDKTYYFDNLNINCYQFLNEEFINKINERSKTENKSPLFTQGDLFNIEGEYI